MVHPNEPEIRRIRNLMRERKRYWIAIKREPSVREHPLHEVQRAEDQKERDAHTGEISRWYFDSFY